ncbi:MAG: sulfatase modifying factor 1 [Planctomycetota bacterium]
MLRRGYPQPSELAVFGQARPRKVGQTRANRFGLFDFGGNVAEWCLDYATKGEGPLIKTSAGCNIDPVSLDGDYAVYRGGAYNSPSKDCRAAARAAWPKDQTSETIGFRPVLVRR